MARICSAPTSYLPHCSDRRALLACSVSLRKPTHPRQSADRFTARFRIVTVGQFETFASRPGSPDSCPSIAVESRSIQPKLPDHTRVVCASSGISQLPPGTVATIRHNCNPLRGTIAVETRATITATGHCQAPGFIVCRRLQDDVNCRVCWMRRIPMRRGPWFWIFFAEGLFR